MEGNDYIPARESMSRPAGLFMNETVPNTLLAFKPSSLEFKPSSLKFFVCCVLYKVSI